MNETENMNTPNDPETPAPEALADAPCSAGLYFEIEGSTKGELWDNLVSLVSFACSRKQEEEHVWPEMVSTDAGMIKVVKSEAAGTDKQNSANNLTP